MLLITVVIYINWIFLLGKIIKYGPDRTVLDSNGYPSYEIVADISSHVDSTLVSPFSSEIYRDIESISCMEMLGPDLYFNKVKARQIYKVTPFSTTPELVATAGSGISDSAGYLTSIGIDNNGVIYGAKLRIHI